MADAYGPWCLRARGVVDPRKFIKLVEAVYGEIAAEFSSEVIGNQSVLISIDEAHYPVALPNHQNNFPYDDEGNELEDEDTASERDRKELIALLQGHLGSDGIIVIACSSREKFRYLRAEQAWITKTSFGEKGLSTGFMDLDWNPQDLAALKASVMKSDGDAL